METSIAQRPDVDIEEDLREFIRSYDPLKQARGHFQFSSVNGHVVLSGNVRSMQARRVFVDNAPDIQGVLSVDSSQLYDDEALRIKLGELLPAHALVRINYGSVAVTLPVGTNAEPLLEAIKKIPGVRAVAAEFI